MVANPESNLGVVRARNRTAATSPILSLVITAALVLTLEYFGGATKLGSSTARHSRIAEGRDAALEVLVRESGFRPIVLRSRAITLYAIS
jgi:hypothetical protein